MKESYRKGVGNYLAPSLAATTRDLAKPRQGIGGVGESSFGTTRKVRRKLRCSFGGKPTEVKSELVAWIAGKRETENRISGY
jgi:hypothetical protein